MDHLSDDFLRVQVSSVATGEQALHDALESMTVPVGIDSSTPCCDIYVCPICFQGYETGPVNARASRWHCRCKAPFVFECPACSLIDCLDVQELSLTPCIARNLLEDLSKGQGRATGTLKHWGFEAIPTTPDMQFEWPVHTQWVVTSGHDKWRILQAAIWPHLEHDSDLYKMWIAILCSVFERKAELHQRREFQVVSS